jgi:hypothetical protein
MRIDKGEKLVEELATLQTKISEEFRDSGETNFEKIAAKYVAKLRVIHRKVRKYNSRLKDNRFKPAFQKLETVVANYIEFLQSNDRKHADVIYAAMLKGAEEYVALLPGSDPH